MVSAGPVGGDRARVRFLQVSMSVALMLLALPLWRLQVWRAREFRTSEHEQSLRRVRLPAARGRVFDRHGVCLVDNRPSYSVVMYVEELRPPKRDVSLVDRIDQEIDRLARVLRLPRQVTRENVQSHITRRRPLAFVAWKGIDEAAMARLQENDAELRGVDIQVDPVRIYSHGRLAAHVLGYVGRLSPDDDEYHFYLPDTEGKCGVERTLNAVLSGEEGGRLIRVDASGFKRSEQCEKAPVPGRDVCLTLDARIQELSESVLEGQRGAVVVVDPRRGDILAMASWPTFDPNAFVPSIDAEAWRRLSDDPDKPLFNRAVGATYPPGSTFKPVVAIAALENGRAGTDTAFDCTGYFELGERRIFCWNAAGHGTLAMRKGIEQSCNSYFCQLGLRCGYERIYHMAEAVGFGQRTGVRLTGEADGLLPNPEWKERVLGEGWRAGDTCNAAIGQGFVLVTPLQMAMFAATLGTGGRLVQPRLVLRTKTQDGTPAAILPGGDVEDGGFVGDMGWSAATLRVVLGGMRDVIQCAEGTGRRAAVEGVEMAGKTGTAEYGSGERKRKYTWMILFAPVEAPRYAATMVVEEGVSGGVTVAPSMHTLMEGVFTLERIAPNGPPDGREVEPGGPGA